MTNRIGNLVYEIDRDDIVSNWLKNKILCYTESLFFEFESNNLSSTIIAALDYSSCDEKVNDFTMFRHLNISNQLDVPYFYVKIHGRVIKSLNLKEIVGYEIDYRKCNKKALYILSNLNNRKYFTEQEYSDFLHYIRGCKFEKVKDLKKEVYASNLSYNKIFRERHAKFGATLYQSDLDLVLYSQYSIYQPVMIIEFKSNLGFHDSISNDRQPGQAMLLSSIGSTLNIPVVRVWHAPNDVSTFYIKKLYNSKGRGFREYFENAEYKGNDFIRKLRLLTETL